MGFSSCWGLDLGWRGLVVRLVVTGWLAVMSVWDVRWRELPHWGTTVPLIALTGWLVFAAVAGGPWLPEAYERWGITDGLAVGLMFGAVLLSDGWLSVVPAAGALVLAFSSGGAQSQTVITGWLLALGLAKGGIVGAGDAKLGMTLMVLFPEMGMGVCLLGAAGLAGLVVLVKRRGRNALPLLWLTLQDALAGRFPARTGEEGGAVMPLASALSLGALFYVWVLSWTRGIRW